MNCKPGEMAIVVGSSWDDGKILTCLKLHPPGFSRFLFSLGPMWEVDRNDIGFGRVTGGGPIGRGNLVADKFLRPLRGGESPEQSADAMRLLTQISKKDKATA